MRLSRQFRLLYSKILQAQKARTKIKNALKKHLREKKSLIHLFGFLFFCAREK